MSKNRVPPPTGDSDLPRSQVILIVVLTFLLLIGGIIFLFWQAQTPPQVATQTPAPTYIPPPPQPQPTPPQASQPVSVVPQPPVEPPVAPPPPLTTQPIPEPLPPPTSRPVAPVPIPRPVVVPKQPVVVVPPPTLPPSIPQRPAKPVRNVQMALGNPTNANSGSGNHNNFLMEKQYFSLSYNDSHGEPNWVSWRVTSEDIAGEAKRKATFDTDKTLPAGLIPITTKDYVNCGFDRGHMCPHSDRDATIESSYATFIMTNIIPQSPHNNQRAWAQLEDYGRTLAVNGQHICVIAGPAGKGGEGKNGKADTIANGRVLVPAWTWKIIVVVPPGPGADVSRITAVSRVIAVLMPNDQSVGEDWKPYICTVADIEVKTGYTFFDTLPADVAAALRVKRDGGR